MTRVRLDSLQVFLMSRSFTIPGGASGGHGCSRSGR
jgi:hypothetical protein